MKPLKPHYDDGMWKGAPKEGFEKARDLRKRATPSEKLLWNKLRNKQLDNFKFRRQHPVSIYIADFYCHDLKLIIEIDGEYHLSPSQKLKDTERTELLNANGLQIIRFTNQEIADDIERVIGLIKNQIKEIQSRNS